MSLAAGKGDKAYTSSYTAGCSCHSAHLAAGKGGKAYTSSSTFNVEDHRVDLHYYFKGNTKRKGILAEYVDFVGLEWGKDAKICYYKIVILRKVLREGNSGNMKL